MATVILVIPARPAIRTASSPTPPPIPGPVRIVAASLVVGAMVLVGCSGEEAVPIDPANPPVVEVEPPDVTHRIEPTPQMEELARQQCIDDPSLDEGYVEAVDPATDQVLSQVSVDCAEVLADG